ncbi:hypothetical protein STEG23_022778, partial [Scotinomys teguina]
MPLRLKDKAGEQNPGGAISPTHSCADTKQGYLELSREGGSLALQNLTVGFAIRVSVSQNLTVGFTIRL